MTIQAISNKLQELSSQLEAGNLSADEIMEMTELARNLHERMIILQYKAFEEQVQIESNDAGFDEPFIEEKVDAEFEQAAQVTEPGPEPEEEKEEVQTPILQEENHDPVVNTVHEPETAPEPVSEPETEAPKVSEPETGPSFRFETPEISPNQISLIDSIEEIKRMEQSINESFKGDDGATLAQRLKKKPVANIKKSMSINQKFQFVSMLFESDSEAFEMAIGRLDGATSYLEADEYIQNTLKNKYDWQMKNPVVKELLDLVERRFL